MPPPKYFFQNKKRGFVKKFFNRGLSTTTYILFTLKESGKLALQDLPSSYPQFKLMKQVFGVEYRGPKFKKETIRTSFYRLRKKGLITKDPKQKFYYLTDEGKDFVSYIENRYLILKKPWDGKLRIVIFDIPEKRKEWRKWLREELGLMQFQQLQKSVYIGKHPLSESFYKEITKAGLNQYVFILTVGKIDKKEKILDMFKEE